MRFLIVFYFLIFYSITLIAQDVGIFNEDTLYREDQFYASATYNLLLKKPDNVSQNGFSSGFHFGFIRDMPINKKRNIAIGLGIGYSGNSFNQNLLIGKDELNTVTYSLLTDDISFTKNKFSTHFIEFPFEFRWRTSTTTSHKFWRLYPGFKLSYLFAHTTKFKGEPQNLKFNNIDHFNNLQYGLTLSFGYNTVNFHFYYALNPIFNNQATINNQVIEMNATKIGLIFYIL